MDPDTSVFCLSSPLIDPDRLDIRMGGQGVDENHLSSILLKPPGLNAGQNLALSILCLDQLVTAQCCCCEHGPPVSSVLLGLIPVRKLLKEYEFLPQKVC